MRDETTTSNFNQSHSNFAQMEHHVQSIDDSLIGGLSYKLKPGASYVTDRRKCTFTPAEVTNIAVLV